MTFEDGACYKRTNVDGLKLLGNSQGERRDPDGFLDDEDSSKWKGMEISDSMDFETSMKERISGRWNKSYLLVSLLSIAMIIAYFDLFSNEVTDEIMYGTSDTKIDALEIESCEAVLQTKNKLTTKLIATVGTCETSGRVPYRKKVKDVRKMKSDVNLISNNGTFGSVKRFVMFFASGRSGHTWLGAILDAAPNAMIANQRNTWHDYFEDDRYKSREDLYSVLAYNSYHCGTSGWLQVYDYSIPGLWQGGIDSSKNAQLEVIGDKAGNGSMRYVKQWIEEVTGEDFDFVFGDYDNYPELVPHVNSRFNEFLSVIRDEPRFIVNLRHPGSIVATLISRHHKGSHELYDEEADWVLTCIRTSLWAMEHIGKKEQWHLVPTEEFAMNTEEELAKLCDFVGLSCPKLMIDTVVEQTHHTVHDTWRNLNWDKEHLDSYNRFIRKYLSDWYQPMCV